MTTKSVLSALVLLAAAIPAERAAAQRDNDDWLEQCRRSGGSWRDETPYCEVRQTGSRAPRGTLTVDGMRNGGITIVGWDRDSLHVVSRIRIEDRDRGDAREIASRIRTYIRGSHVQVEGLRDMGRGSWNVNLVIYTPRRSDIDAATSNGPMAVEDLTGNIRVETSNGPLALRNLAGTVYARTSNGPLSIMLTGSRWQGSGLDARTSNGPLSLKVPDNYSAHLEAGTTNGPLSLGFPVTVVGRISKNISTDLGSGGPTIRAFTTNGPLSIDRR
ncbi:MAG TPA: hypothetical protein VIF83_03995 [Gemmatimonadaceae bacterium]|jgi:hypothetical protein